MTNDCVIPAVFILSQAMDVIRREALKFDVETGGILVGARSKDGATLVTHATPPGPKAVHNAIYFQRDVAFQQTALNELHERFGAQYLGEWHKHPRSLPVPSEGDLAGVKELLADPDYGVDAILFPIVICERDLGFQIHPFYATNREAGTRFHPLKWHELTMSLELDRVFTAKVRDVPRTVGAIEPTGGRNTACPRAQEHTAKLQAWRRIAELLPFFGRSNDQESEEDDERQSCAEVVASSSAVQWYTTPEGRERLGREQRLLRSFGLVTEPFLMGDNSLCFSFPRTGKREIVVICSPNYPEELPQVLVRDAPEGKHRPIRGWPWSSNSLMVDVVVPLLGPELGHGRPCRVSGQDGRDAPEVVGRHSGVELTPQE
jgi:integrative and conjugative element protein (TIGR02256 family)